MTTFAKRAITVHMDAADIMVTEWGKAFYWALTAIFAVSGTLFLYVALMTQNKRLPVFCHLSFLASYVLSMGYFAMAADLGWAAVEVEFVREAWSILGRNPTRQVFWIRYIAWLVATPLQNTQLFLLVSASIETTLLDTFFVFVVIATGLGGAVIPSSYKWGYYFYGAIACAGIGYLIAYHGYGLAAAKGGKLRQLYLLTSSAIGVVWFCYGLAWGLSEGGTLFLRTQRGSSTVYWI
ncbi:hypothetical protein PT974_02096 [Cladobotryum mycophilum]|uniref:Opsin n=1 Tax=Cladobotryum mycophilum TaxID=491253 RepID=A0ABR0SYB0_9HYPO